MQEPQKKSSFTSLFTSALKRNDIINALQNEDKKSILRTETKNFIYDIILPFLRITADEPTHLSSVVKAIFNIIYYIEAPDRRITYLPEYLLTKKKPVIHFYFSEEQECTRWLPLYMEWCAQVEPHEPISKTMLRIPKNVDLSTFETCLLAAIPADGTVFVPNALCLARLQKLARKHNIIPKEPAQDKNHVVLQPLRPGAQ